MLLFIRYLTCCSEWELYSMYIWLLNHICTLSLASRRRNFCIQIFSRKTKNETGAQQTLHAAVNGKTANADLYINNISDIKKSVKRNTAGMTDDQITNANKIISRLRQDALGSKYLTDMVGLSDSRLKDVIRDSVRSSSIDAAKSYIAWVDPVDFIFLPGMQRTCILSAMILQSVSRKAAKNSAESTRFSALFQCVDKVAALKIFESRAFKYCACGRFMRREGASRPAPSQIPAT